MKKTTWVIIGLSLCIVVLSTALGIVLLQQKADTILMRESKDDSLSTMSEELRKRIESFNINPRRPKDALYFNQEAYIKSHPENVVIVGGDPRTRLKVYKNKGATTYVITKEKK